MQADELIVARLLAGKVRAKDVEHADRDAAILQLHAAGAEDGAIVNRLSCNVVTVRSVIERETAKQARRAARNTWVVSA